MYITLGRRHRESREDSSVELCCFDENTTRDKRHKHDMSTQPSIPPG